MTSAGGGVGGVTTGGGLGASMPSEQPASSAAAASDDNANARENPPRARGLENRPCIANPSEPGFWTRRSTAPSRFITRARHCKQRATVHSPLATASVFYCAATVSGEYV